MISEGGITIGYDNPRRAKSGKSIVTRWTSYLNDRSRVTFFQFDHESIRFIYHQLTDVNLPNVRVETKGPSLVDLIALTRSIEWTNQRTAGVHARKRTKQLLLDRFVRRSFPRGARSKRSNYPFRGQRLFCLNLRSIIVSRPLLCLRRIYRIRFLHLGDQRASLSSDFSIVSIPIRRL